VPSTVENYHNERTLPCGPFSVNDTFTAWCRSPSEHPLRTKRTAEDCGRSTARITHRNKDYQLMEVMREISKLRLSGVDIFGP
jgi:hypothetical protein